MLQADPALMAQFQSCTDPASAAALIAKAAATKGIDLGAAAAALGQGALADADMEQVGGGVDVLTKAELEQTIKDLLDTRKAFQSPPSNRP